MQDRSNARHEDIYNSIENMQKFARFIRSYCGPVLEDGNKQREAWHVWRLIKSVGGFEYVFTNDLWDDLENRYASLAEQLNMPLFESACKWTLANFIFKHMKKPLDDPSGLGELLVRPRLDSSLNSFVYADKNRQRFTALRMKMDDLTKSQLRMYVRQLETESLMIESDTDLVNIICEGQGHFNYSKHSKTQQGISNLANDLIQKQLCSNDYQQLSSSISSEYKFASCFDGLSFLDINEMSQNVPKLTEVTSSLKTSGTEKPMRLAATYINLGPNEIEWCCVSDSNVPNLRKLIFADRKADILSENYHLKEDFYYLTANEIPVSKFIQEPFEVVVLNSGTFYWQKFIGKTRIIEWNYCPLDHQSLSNLYAKWQINNCLGNRNAINAIALFRQLANANSIHMPENSQK